MSCIVRLADTDAAWLRKDYAWQHTSRQPEVPVDLRPQVPPGARWRTRADFTRTVTGDSYTATFLADLERKVLVFDAVNPEKKG